MSDECTRTAHYPTDMSDAEWTLIRPFVDVREHRGAPRVVCLRCIINALFYLNKTGCQWDMLPRDFPPHATVYWYFRKWLDNGTWKRINDELRRNVRLGFEQSEEPSAAIIDSQSVKTTEVGGDDIGFDANKNVNGRKRHIAIDTLGLLLAVAVTAASLQDANSATTIGERMQGKFPRLKTIWVDAGYKAQFIAWFKEHCAWIVEVVTRREGAIGFEVQPHRWLVERTLGWFNLCRRLSKDDEYYPEVSEGMVYLASIRLMLQRLAPQFDEDPSLLNC